MIKSLGKPLGNSLTLDKGKPKIAQDGLLSIVCLVHNNKEYKQRYIKNLEQVQERFKDVETKIEAIFFDCQMMWA